MSNRIVKEMGFDWFDQVENAPGFEALMKNGGGRVISRVPDAVHVSALRATCALIRTVPSRRTGRSRSATHHSVAALRSPRTRL